MNYIKTKMAGDLYTVMTTENAEHLLTAQSTIGLGFLNSLKVHTHLFDLSNCFSVSLNICYCYDKKF